MHNRFCHDTYDDNDIICVRDNHKLTVQTNRRIKLSNYNSSCTKNTKIKAPFSQSKYQHLAPVSIV